MLFEYFKNKYIIILDLTFIISVNFELKIRYGLSLNKIRFGELPMERLYRFKSWIDCLKED